MTVDAATGVPAQLTRVETRGPLRGLGGLVAAELRRWFPWRALVLSLIGVAWMIAFFLVWLGPISYVSGGPRLLLLLGNLFTVWSAVLVLVVVATTQGAMADEIEDGTAAWVVAKPVGRPAFVLSKFIAAIPGVVIGAVAVPGVVAWFILVDAESREDAEFTANEVLDLIGGGGRKEEEFTTLPDLGRYAGSLVLIAVVLTFVAALMILLGTAIRSRAAIFLLGVGIAIALLVYGLVGPDSVVELLPSAAFESSLRSLADEAAPVLWPAITTFGWSVACVGAAMWLFTRKEL